MSKLTDEQAKRADDMIKNYRSDMEASVRELEEHRKPCGEEEYIEVVGRQLGATEKDEIKFPPGGTRLPLTNKDAYISIKLSDTEKDKEK